MGLTWSNRIGVATSFSGLFSTSSFTSHHPTPEQRLESATRPGVKRTKRKCIAWASIAVMLILASAYIPAEAARIIRSPLLFMPGRILRPPTDLSITGRVGEPRKIITGELVDSDLLTNDLARIGQMNLSPRIFHEVPRIHSLEITPDFFRAEMLLQNSSVTSVKGSTGTISDQGAIRRGMIFNSGPVVPDHSTPKWFGTLVIATNLLRNIY